MGKGCTRSKEDLAGIFADIADKSENKGGDAARRLAETIFERSARGFKEDFKRYLEGVSIWLQSLMGLESGVCGSRIDQMKISRSSLDQMVEKADEFRKFLDRNDRHSSFVSRQKRRYARKLEVEVEALAIVEKFGTLANSNLGKMGLLRSDIRHLVRDLEMREEKLQDKGGNGEQRRMEVLDALARVLVLEHSPVGSVHERFG